MWDEVRRRLPRLGLRTAARRALRTVDHQRKRLHARLGGPRVGRKEVARALGVGGRDLAGAGRAIRMAMASRLPVGPAAAGLIGEILARETPGEIASAVSAADRICAHVFDLLGSGPVCLGEEIDWHRDFKSGYRWTPTQFYADVPWGHIPGVDIKVPWELSRCHQLPVLAQAYRYTGREQYAREAVAQIRHWRATNPPQLGVNWACPMDVAIRAVNWLWTAALLADAGAVPDEFFVDLYAALVEHARHVAGNLEVWGGDLRSNHYLADVVGLLYLGLCLPEFGEAADWRALALDAVVREMGNQVLADGVDFESSVPYHRLVTEMFLSAASLCRHHAVPLPPTFWRRLSQMLDFAMAYTKPNGLAPQVGDADDGRLHVLSRYGAADPRDHRHLLAVGAMLLGRDDWWAAAGPAWHEALWLGGWRGPRWQRRSHLPAASRGSAAFPEAGLYIMRGGEDYVLLNCSPVGTRGTGSHKHNDTLSLEVHLGGEDVLVDPGSYVYSPDPEARNLFRGTAAHSTVTVDGTEQNRFHPGSVFGLGQDARPRVLLTEAGATEDTVVAEHDGYRRLPDPVLHRRAVRFLRGAGRVEVHDLLVGLEGSGAAHDLVWTFPFAPGCVVEPGPGGWSVQGRQRRARLSAPVSDPGGDPVPVDVTLDEGCVSPGYGVREPAPVLRWRWRGSLPLSVRFAIQRT